MWDIFIDVGTGIIEWLLQRGSDSDERTKRFPTPNERAQKRRRISRKKTVASPSDGKSADGRRDDRDNVDVLRVGP